MELYPLYRHGGAMHSISDFGILRRSAGKDFAEIYDFIVVLQEPQRLSSIRARTGGADFARNLLYPASSIEPLMPLLRRYEIEHLAA